VSIKDMTPQEFGKIIQGGTFDEYQIVDVSVAVFIQFCANSSDRSERNMN
jgi:hypothetical protein